MELTIEMIVTELLRLQASTAALAEVLARDYNITLPPDYEVIYRKHLAEFAPKLGLEYTPPADSPTQQTGRPLLRLVRKEDE